MNSKLIIAVIFIIIVLASITYAPYFLTYADKPEKADVVVLFVGADNKARGREATKLLQEGYAQYIITPAYGTTFGYSIVDKPSHVAKLPVTVGPINKKTYPRYYENTHVEALEAKKIMDKAGFKSAIFVSSPLHMRRIKIITGTVFKEKYSNITFVSTRYEKTFGISGPFSIRAVENVMTEYVKMGWFLTYKMFS